MSFVKLPTALTMCSGAKAFSSQGQIGECQDYSNATHPYSLIVNIIHIKEEATGYKGVRWRKSSLLR